MTKNCWSGAAIGDDVSGDSQSLRISLEWVRWMVRNSQMLKIYDGSPSPESKKNIWLWLTVCHGKSQFLIGKLEFLWAIYTMAMLNKQRVSSFFICPVICVQFFWGGYRVPISGQTDITPFVIYSTIFTVFPLWLVLNPYLCWLNRIESQMMFLLNY